MGKYKRSVIKHHSASGLGLHTFFIEFIGFFCVCAGVILLTKIMCVSTCRGLLRKMAEATSINSDEFANFSFTPPRPRGRLRSFSRSHRSKYYAMTPNISASKKFGSNTSLTSYGKCLLPSQFHLSVSTQTAL